MVTVWQKSSRRPRTRTRSAAILGRSGSHGIAAPYTSPRAQVAGALSKYSRVRVLRTAIVQGFAQLGSDLLVDFDLMMTIPLIGPFFLTATQLSMPWVLRFLYTPEF